MEADIEGEGRMCHEEALIRCGGGVGGGGKVVLVEGDIEREGRVCHERVAGKMWGRGA